MDRGTRTAIVVAVAVATAAAASASVYRAIRRIPVREVQVAHQFIVLAARPVPLGTRLTTADVKVVAWPSDSPLPGAFSRADQVVGRGVVAALAANEPLSDAKLAPRDAGAGLSPAIPAGMRAISVKVNEVIGVAGFVVPGARVDVVATVRRTDDAVSRVLISNVQVLTAGTRYDQEKPRDAKPIPSTVVTLVVSPSQAEKIALASAEGQLTLMLRNPLDVAEPSTAGAHLARLVDDPAPVAVATAGVIAGARKPARAAARPEAAAVPAPAEPVYTVEAIRSGKRTTEAILK
jgi:pilus assembly protein CpaB